MSGDTAHPEERTSRGVLLALGGNALIRPGEEGDIPQQRRRAEETFRAVLPLVLEHERVVIVHGNGPQVGNELLRSEMAEAELDPLPLDVLVADCQGAMGYLLQQVLGAALAESGAEREVVTVVTQVVVDAEDPAFERPTKPIGRFLSRDESRRKEELGWTMVEDAGRGFRRVVASPKPREVVEIACIRTLWEAGAVVVAGGGGGIPVVRDGRALRGVEGVIDKDHVASLLARELRCELVVLLTAVDHVHVHHGTSSERALGEVSPAELRAHEAAGEFPPGSMGPKVRCALQVVEDVPGARVLITSPEAVARGGSQAVGTCVRA